MRTPLPPDYYEARLFKQYGQDYDIVPSAEWHGLRTDVTIFCEKHGTFRTVYLKKVFNGLKSTWPCRKCYLDSLKNPSPTPQQDV